MDGGQAGRVTAGRDLRVVGARKVRAPQSRMVGNAHSGEPAGKCHRKQTARPRSVRAAGEGEKVV
ncbi:hypothetical protein KTU01_03430 [Kocuria turfanensis]|uniref:Uncharacterized protein n=1 Tax=Kocuria turfanensis TaxID=388357 RepID=A0A512I970_9MICC|nr:hypothetical protein KTU01_03430 [Kocuria turfanensis]